MSESKSKPWYKFTRAEWITACKSTCAKARDISIKPKIGVEAAEKGVHEDAASVVSRGEKGKNPARSRR